MYRLATKSTEKIESRQREHERFKQSKTSIRTARRMPCRQYDRLFIATAELLVSVMYL